MQIKKKGKITLAILGVAVFVVVASIVCEPSVTLFEFSDYFEPTMIDKQQCFPIIISPGWRSLELLKEVPFWVKYNPLHIYYRNTSPSGGRIAENGGEYTGTNINVYECGEKIIKIHIYVVSSRVCALTIYHSADAAEIARNVKIMITSQFFLFPVRLIEQEEVKYGI